MSSILDNKKNKDKCQKFTPENIVSEMLDLAGYTHHLSGKKVLENSFGSGNVLVAIVKRYIVDSLNAGIPVSSIAANLETDIYGVELDRELFGICIERLNKITNEYGIPPVKWLLFNENALTWKCDVTFDFIIGNPPYITYKDIDDDSRRFLKQTFSSCSNGKFDYCYAFIERSINLLSDKGKLVQLVPTNIYKNVFGKNLRSILLPYVDVIKEYPGEKLFADTLTSSTVFLFDKSTESANVTYSDMSAKKTFVFPRSSLGEKWVFTEKEDQKQRTAVRFGDCFNASIVVATLLNEAFLLSPDDVRETGIEQAVIRRAASPKKMRQKVVEYIIFPYYYEGGTFHRYAKEEFENKFPNAVGHLNLYKEKLDKRDVDNNTEWFEYGRTQALTRLNQRKLLMSTVLTNHAEIYELDADTIPYSGIFITVKKPEYTLADAERILRDERFVKYVKSIGISVSGNSKRITCKDVNNYMFVRE